MAIDHYHRPKGPKEEGKSRLIQEIIDVHVKYVGGQA
jgi:hypothetical protein